MPSSAPIARPQAQAHLIIPSSSSSSSSSSNSTSSSNPNSNSNTNTTPTQAKRPKLGTKAWVEPATLPRADSAALEHPDASRIAGNAPLRAKQLALNTFAAYGVGDAQAFGHAAGRKVRFVRMDVGVGCDADADGNENANANASGRRKGRRAATPGRKESIEPNGHSASSATATVIAELIVDKSMVNGNGMMHGGCLAYLIDNCGSVPLIILGVVRGRNGVGVTQALNILFHAPAPLGSRLEIISTSLALGGRSMTSRCEILDKTTGRLVASAFINKMEPKL
ncbi:hypothetical protein ACEPAH_2954 [Sanghuangporus vaninii]